MHVCDKTFHKVLMGVYKEMTFYLIDYVININLPHVTRFDFRCTFLSPGHSYTYNKKKGWELGVRKLYLVNFLAIGVIPNWLAPLYFC